MDYVFLACYHDRHTDDKYEAFTNEADAKNQCRTWFRHWVGSCEENHQYGDWCLFVDDDYYTFVQKVAVRS